MAKKLSSDSTLFAVTLALLAMGLVMVWSASSALAEESHGNAYHFLVKQVVWAALGLIVMGAAMRIDYRKLRQPAAVYSAVGLTTVVPFLVEDALKANGGKYSKAADWADYAVADGNLITGQNPASSESTARELLKQLEAGLGMTAGSGSQRR